MSETINHIEQNMHYGLDHLAPDNRLVVTDQEVIPHLPDALGQLGIDREALHDKELKQHDVDSRHGVTLDVHNLEDINDDGLIGVIEMGSTAVQIHALKEDGKLVPGNFFISHKEFDPNPPEDEFGWARKIQFMHVGAGANLTLGRTTAGANRIGIDKDPLVSREHLHISVTPDGKLVLKDLASTNGTKLITAEKQPVFDRLHTARSIGDVSVRAEAQAPPSKEKMINGVNFKIEGVVPISGREAYALSTHDQDGVVRNIVVYRSASEGGLRVGTGFEESGRIMKGAEGSTNFQYTQDTQLHAEFAAALDEMIQSTDLVVKDPADFTIPTEEGRKEVEKDFESRVSVYRMGSQELHDALKVLPAGMLGENYVNNVLSVSEQDNRPVQDKLAWHVHTLNEQLVKENLMPDFSTPFKVETDTHPILGDITRESFYKSMNGRAYEWKMGYDKSGRVWIDRIRLMDTEANAYGTDTELLYSGLLTSKPIDYNPQVSGISEALRSEIPDTNYSDITPFLDSLVPIQNFRKQRAVTRVSK